MRMKNGWPTWTPTSSGSKRRGTCCKPRDSSTKCGREKEAVAEIAAMFGWKNFLGHLCGGGTMANLEALWVAGQIQPGKKILASEQAHYTHGRISGVLRMEFESVEVDSFGRMDAGALRKRV